ncbi:MAG: lipase family protein [Thermonemataceae bacterium]|nr:lipase family protein [Thermonemataceae bacterium]
MIQLLPNAQEFELQNAIHLAEISQLSYQNEVSFRNSAIPFYTNVHFIESPQNSGYDAEVFVCSNEAAIVVAFRGTESESTEDWLSNIDNRTFGYATGNVRQGFWQSLESVWFSLKKSVQDLQNNHQKIWLTGHSQGGALATLAARRFVDENMTTQGVYTFGQPKVGDMLFAANYDSFLKSKTFRVYNEGDSVVDNPPKLYHIGTAIKLTHNGEVEIQSQHNLFDFGENSFMNLLDTIFEYATDDLKAHHIETYLQRLSQKISS